MGWREFFLEMVVDGMFLFTLAIVLVVAVVFILDVTQTRNAIRRNFPVVGHLRYFFSWLGRFFRQYFFAMDREELPFNRAERDWVNHAADSRDMTVAFGSTRDLRPVGSVLFVSSPFPRLDHKAESRPLVIGEGCSHPYAARSLFNISAMSFGAISQPAVTALSRGCAAAGSWMSTGEGGLSPYHLEGGADIVFQIGTAKYGVRDADGRLDPARLKQVTGHEQVRMVEIKLSQGAKPGKGGILPGAKVTAEIAAIRGIPEGQDSISPNRHPDIANVGDLLDMIARVRDLTGKPVGFKTVIGDPGWLELLFEEVHRRGAHSAPDFITIDSADGGTGAAPQSLIDYMGMPLAESLPAVADKLVEYDLKSRIRLIASGKLIGPANVAWALCAGADFVQSARGFMFALGCIQAMQCNRNTCPTGITTHDPRLQRGLDPEAKSVRVTNYIRNLVHEVEVIAHSCGVAEPRDLRRHHARIVQADERSIPLDAMYPVPVVRHPLQTAAE